MSVKLLRKKNSKILNLVFPSSVASLPHVKCTRTFKKLGCFMAASKPLDKLLINDRDKESPYRVDWKNWEAYVHRYKRGYIS